MLHRNVIGKSKSRSSEQEEWKASGHRKKGRSGQCVLKVKSWTWYSQQIELFFLRLLFHRHLRANVSTIVTGIACLPLIIENTRYNSPEHKCMQRTPQSSSSRQEAARRARCVTGAANVRWSPSPSSNDSKKFQHADGKSGLALTRNTNRRSFCFEFPLLYDRRSFLCRAISHVASLASWVTLCCHFAAKPMPL